MFPRLTMTFAIVLLSGSCGPGVWAQDAAKEKALSDKVWDVLRGAKQIDLFVLDPAGKDVFRGEWKHQGGKCTVSGAKVRKEIIDALQEGVKKADKGDKNKKGKFQPGYGVRATSGGITVEMVIDFDLGEIRVFSGKEKAVIPTSDSPKSLFETLFRV